MRKRVAMESERLRRVLDPMRADADMLPDSP
jgi:hypothetical protein